MFRKVPLLAMITIGMTVSYPSETALGATYVVSPAGNGDFATIGAAIAAAENGDLILVKPGIYAEDISFSGKEVEIRSTDGASETIIEADSTALSAVQGEGSNAVFDGFTLTGQGFGSTARGLYIRNSSPQIKNLVVKDIGSASLHGNGAYITGITAQPAFTGVRFEGLLSNRGTVFVNGGAVPTLTAVEFEDNQCASGGAIYADGEAHVQITDLRAVGNRVSDGGGGIFLSDARIEIDGAHFESNRLSSASSPYGGGHLRLLDGAQMDLQSATFIGDGSGSVAGAEGGALYLADGASFEGRDLRFESLEVTDSGGAIFVDNGGVVEITDARFIANRARQGSGGAVALVEGGQFDCTFCRFADNSALGQGGGLFAQGALARVEAGSFCGNTSVNGGAIYASNANVAALNGIFRKNQGEYGGALFVEGGDLAWVNNTAVANIADGGAGLWITQNGQYDIRNNIVYGQGGAGIEAADSAAVGPLTQGIAFNDIVGNSGQDFAGYLSDLSGQLGNISVEPAFWGFDASASCDEDLLYLTPESPCKDAGDPALLDPDGSRSDMGAFGGPGSQDLDDDGDGYNRAAGDCANDDGAIHPFADESEDGHGDGVDNDCDGRVDEGTLDYDDDGDGLSEAEGDCADDNPAIYPHALENADGIDGDCDGIVDENTIAFDDDADGVSEEQGDCNDDTDVVYPGANELVNNRDEDCDGRIDEGTVAYDDDGDGFSEDGTIGGELDCNDDNEAIHPEASEGQGEGNGVDDDCDDEVDEGTLTFDDDLDGYTEMQGDCDDSSPHNHPEADEFADGQDQDCDGRIDESTDAADDDGDGYAEADGDCDDANAGAAPNLPESIDAVDNDCDGRIDEGTSVFDDDGDGYTEEEGDCDDEKPEISPDAEEITDGADNDCDDVVDELAVVVDADADGFSIEEGDCDDGDANIHPDGEEIPYDGVDNDCADGDLVDVDGDGYPGPIEDCADDDQAIHPDAEEIADGLDNDCDGSIDEGFATTPPPCTTEVLDGADNDCDGYVDEDVTVETPTPGSTPPPEPTETPPPETESPNETAGETPTEGDGMVLEGGCNSAASGGGLSPWTLLLALPILLRRRVRGRALSRPWHPGPV